MVTSPTLEKARLTEDNLLDLPRTLRERLAELPDREVSVADLGNIVILFPAPCRTDALLDDFAKKVDSAGLTPEELLTRLREARYGTA